MGGEIRERRDRRQAWGWPSSGRQNGDSHYQKETQAPVAQTPEFMMCQLPMPGKASSKRNTRRRNVAKKLGNIMHVADRRLAVSRRCPGCGQMSPAPICDGFKRCHGDFRFKIAAALQQHSAVTTATSAGLSGAPNGHCTTPGCLRRAQPRAPTGWPLARVSDLAT